MSIWDENVAIDRILASLQMQAVETHVKDSFTLNRADRNRTRMKIKDIVDKHYIKRSEVKSLEER